MGKECLIILLLVFSSSPIFAQMPALYTPTGGYGLNDHIVSASVFHWYISGGGQVSSPWIALGGRASWTGEVGWWKGQIKQMMMANIDVLYVELIPFMEEQRINLFQALSELRKEGYDVPKVAPFLDPVITWSIYGNPPDCATTAGKDAFVNEYIRFFQQYYSVNTDAYADYYLATINGKVVLDTWLLASIPNVQSLSRVDLESRLANAFGTAHPVFNQGIYMITLVSGVSFLFTDEKIFQFEGDYFYYPYTYNGMTTAMVKPGFWNQNVCNPGTQLVRNGGSNYINAWSTALANTAIKHIYVESFNEYDEGSGIYAADPVNSPYVIPPNSGTDTWSDTDDPYEYIRTTWVYARDFNISADYGSKILWNNFPDYMYPGEHKTVRVVVRNEGDLPWSENDLFRFGQKEYLQGETLFGTGRYLVDDTANEVNTYGGVFRGRSVTFEVELIAPTTQGTYVTHWGMLREGVQWFGPELVHTFRVLPADIVPYQYTPAKNWGPANADVAFTDGVIGTDYMNEPNLRMGWGPYEGFTIYLDMRFTQPLGLIEFNYFVKSIYNVMPPESVEVYVSTQDTLSLPTSWTHVKTYTNIPSSTDGADTLAMYLNGYRARWVKVVVNDGGEWTVPCEFVVTPPPCAIVNYEHTPAEAWGAADSDLALKDGVFGTSNYFSQPELQSAWGPNEGFTTWLDLGSIQDIGGIDFNYFVYAAHGVVDPCSVTIAVSSMADPNRTDPGNTTDWSSAGTFTNLPSTSGAPTAHFPLTGQSGRWVRMVVEASGEWTMPCEIKVRPPCSVLDYEYTPAKSWGSANADVVFTDGAFGMTYYFNQTELQSAWGPYAGFATWLDLGWVQDIDGLDFNYFVYAAHGVVDPCSVTISVSSLADPNRTDPSNTTDWSSAGTFTNFPSTSGAPTAHLALTENSGRWVRMVVEAGGEWTMPCEIKVIPPASDYKYNPGKNWGPADPAIALMDGVVGTDYINEPNLRMGWGPNEGFTIYIDMQSPQLLGNIDFNYFVYPAHGVMPPDSVEVYVSSQNTVTPPNGWTYVRRYTDIPSSSGADTLAMCLNGYTARWVKVVVKAGGEWTVPCEFTVTPPQLYSVSAYQYTPAKNWGDANPNIAFTDGVIGTCYLNEDDLRMVWGPNAGFTICLDLGEIQDLGLTAFNYFVHTAHAVMPPSSVAVSISSQDTDTCPTTWNNVETYTDIPTSAGAGTLTMNLTGNSARWVKIVVEDGGEWTVPCEITFFVPNE
ncbi:MAG: hypothetical protein A2Y12_19780 [Planctomycetes bacterium GWF2_42_9]|nr:MAG: hypothetical protein A2Y12_19780 [Planctomycetes bacterium GWF2_42_9]